MKLNKEELLIGFTTGICSWLVIGFWAIPVALVTSFFWAYTGAGASKLYRRLGVPALISVACAVAKHTWSPLISIPPGFAVLSLGYGIPTLMPPDNGSVIGRIAFKLAKGKEDLAQIYCRTFIYTLLLLAFLPCLLAN